MSDRQRLLFLVLILAVVVSFVAGVTNHLLYNAALKQNRERLLVSARSQARLMETVARFDQQYVTDYPDGAFAATVSKIVEAHSNFKPVGKTGEFTIASRKGDQIIFLFRQRHQRLKIPEPIPFDSDLAEPMRHALRGQSGTLIGLDYRGETVMAAFEPVAVLNLGIVAKIDLAEIRAAFVTTGIVTGLLAFAAIIAGAFLFVRTTNPMIGRIQESEEKFRNLFEHANDSIFIIDPSTKRFLEVNENAARRLKYTKDELLQKRANDLIPPGKEEKARQAVQELTATGSTVFETVHIRRDNTEMPVEISSRVIQYGGNRVFQSFVRDIAERKQAAGELEQIKVTFQAILDNLPAAVSLKDPQGRYIFVNRVFEQWLAVSSSEVMGRSAEELFPDLSDAIKEQDAAIQENMGVTTTERVIRFSDGVERFSNITKFPVIGSADTFLGVGTIITDITQQKSSEEELKQLAVAVNQADEGIVVTSRSGTIQYANPAFERITGYTREEIAGQTPRLLKSGMQDEAFYANLWKTITNGGVWSGEVINKKKDGTFYNADLTITPVVETNGKISNFIGIHRDVTERKIAAEQIELQKKQLIQADKMASLGILVSGVAHEINNPNGFIMFNVPLLERIWSDALIVLERERQRGGEFTLGTLPFDKAAEAVPKLLTGISKGSLRIKKIVGNLRDFARWRESAELRPVDLNAVLDSAVSLLTNEINKRTKNFSVQYEPNLPPVLGDFQKIEQVVINLITNACQALADTEKGIRVSTALCPDEGLIQLIVDDEGIGIPEDNLGKIMDPFFTTRRSHGGTGLGLSVSYSIIEEHKGKLEFSSSREKGTTAIITLPAAREGTKESTSPQTGFNVAETAVSTRS